MAPDRRAILGYPQVPQCRAAAAATSGPCAPSCQRWAASSLPSRLITWRRPSPISNATSSTAGSSLATNAGPQVMATPRNTAVSLVRLSGQTSIAALYDIAAATHTARSHSC
jgi:hypothetical protein